MIEKNLTLHVRITEQMKKEIEALATKKGMTSSDYIRYLIIKETDKEKGI